MTFMFRKCYKDNPNLPIAWSSSKSIPLDTQIQWIMHPPRHLVCNEVPATIDDNAGFILPVNLLENIEDVYAAAELGAWEKGTHYARYYEVNFQGNALMRHKEVKPVNPEDNSVGFYRIGRSNRSDVVDKDNVVRIRRRTNPLKSLPSCFCCWI